LAEEFDKVQISSRKLKLKLDLHPNFEPINFPPSTLLQNLFFMNLSNIYFHFNLEAINVPPDVTQFHQNSSTTPTQNTEEQFVSEPIPNFQNQTQSYVNNHNDLLKNVPPPQNLSPTPEGKNYLLFHVIFKFFLLQKLLPSKFSLHLK
jgi:hypothetical protein